MVSVLSQSTAFHDIAKVTDITFKILLSKSFIDLQIVEILFAKFDVKSGDFEILELGVLQVKVLIEIVVPQIFLELCSLDR